MTRDEIKQLCLDKAEGAENGADAEKWIDAYCSLEKNEMQAEKNAADYELNEKKIDSEANIEHMKVQNEAENNDKELEVREKDSKRKNWLIFAGVAVGAIITEGIRAISKHMMAEKIIYAEKHDDLYVNGNKYNDKQF